MLICDRAGCGLIQGADGAAFALMVGDSGTGSTTLYQHGSSDHYAMRGRGRGAGMSETPDRIGRYTVSRRLGAGGMGEVFLAYSPAGEPVAVKLIRADRLDQQTRARFEQEALKARTIVGTSRVAHFLDADPYDEPRPWLAMEYVPGPTLDAFIDAAGSLPPLLVASLGALLAEALAAVHAVGLLHRDLKPGNVILGEDGPVIIDFGLAAFADGRSSLSHAGMQIGTPVTMPPEQANGQTQVTPGADVYGLGTVLLYAAAGHYPYSGVTRDVILTRVASPDVEPELSGLPSQLAPLLSAMLAHDPASRPSLDQVTEACAAHVAGQGLTMARARRALLAHFARNIEPVPDSEDGYEVSSSLEARIDAEAAALAQAQNMGSPVLDSPLNGSPGLYEQLMREAADAQAVPEEAPTAAASDVTAGSGMVPAPRVPASQRIAEELRRAYALRSSL
ncbi:serine/threonine protein kinase [Catenulispora sp. NF23]|uniref:serine/threonine-protein kinase n=1 Tax=Catenulispora pinistramenti TaxID=2705254 RepID=UPI001BAB3A5F|nr:serine/threonine-protein kinase [Catenulispora pinistramenti]MBS2532563.1 serine/threonine protein kinase [Catenulispora pinistramenti]